MREGSPPPPVTCDVSHVPCRMSLLFLFLFLFFLQSGGASRWRVCYQRGLPRLVLPGGWNQFLQKVFYSSSFRI